MKKVKIITAIVFAILVCIFLFSIILKRYIYKLDYLDIVNKVIDENNYLGIDPYLVMSVIKVESSFNKNATSAKEAKGLMQILDSTSLEIGKSVNIVNTNEGLNLYDPNTNILIGVTYLKRLIDKYDGNYYLALAAYNGGMGNIQKWLDDKIISYDLNNYVNNDIPFKETKHYVQKVIQTYETYKLLY